MFIFLTVLMVMNGELSARRPSDCDDIYSRRSGVYKIYPKGSAEGFNVYCDMNTNGGRWTMIQRRMDGTTNFYRKWQHYEDGFGNLRREFWLGNFKIHILSAQGTYELRIDMQDFVRNSRYAKYSTFMLGDASSKYKLLVDGYRGNAGDNLGYHSGRAFSTKDQDNDSAGSNCAVLYKGGWWYGSCHSSNLNGLYLNGPHSSYANGVNWKSWKGYHYSLKYASMMIRRRQ